MDEQLREKLLTYLQKPGFRRLWTAAKDKLERLDRVGGRVRLNNLSYEERDALQGLLAVNLHARESFSIDLKQLDTALQNTRFEASLDECVSLLFPDSFVSRRQLRDAKRDAWASFCSWAYDSVTRLELKSWVTSLAEGSGIGYRTFRECFADFQDRGTSSEWKDAVTALEALPVWDADRVAELGGASAETLHAALQNVRLPVFATKTTGDAHGLDKSNLTGRLFFWGLVAMNNAGPADIADMSSELRDESMTTVETSDFYSDEVRSLYLQFGIVLDDMSSAVLAAGLTSGLTELQRFPVALTLWTVERMPLTSHPGDVFVVENPSIFGTILDRSTVSTLPHILICTSGRPSLAALRLLDQVIFSGGTIYYSGDLDAAGLQIAVSLATRYGDSFVPWRMSAKDYWQAQRSHLNFPALTSADKKSLSNLTLPWESNRQELLPAEMISSGVKVFQEHLIDELVSDYFSL